MPGTYNHAVIIEARQSSMVSPGSLAFFISASSINEHIAWHLIAAQKS
jgi:hypothetical protein